MGTGIGESFTHCQGWARKCWGFSSLVCDIWGHFRPLALPEDCLAFLFFVSSVERKPMKAMTFDKSFAEKKRYFRESHRESFADGSNNIWKAVLYNTPYTGFSINSHIPFVSFRNTCRTAYGLNLTGDCPRLRRDPHQVSAGLCAMLASGPWDFTAFHKTSLSTKGLATAIQKPLY